MDINVEELEYGIQYDLEMNNGHVHKGWYLYDADCAYFTKEQGVQTKGFVYGEDIKSVTGTNPRD